MPATTAAELAPGRPEPAAWWRRTPAEAAGLLATSLDAGLGAAEAAARLARLGPNRLPAPPPAPAWRLAAAQFRPVIVQVLLGAAGLSAALGHSLDAAAILAIVVLNAGLGFMQEYRAEASLAALARLAVPRCRVLRDGAAAVVETESLVPGDLALLEAGDRVPADGLLAGAAGLEVTESVLTGESEPVGKSAGALDSPALALADRRNMLYCGATLLRGRARLLVTATGRQTELGRIAALIAEPRTDTPLQRRLDGLGRRLIALCLGVVAVVFALGLWRGVPPLELLLTSVSLAVAAIPEGLPAVVTFTLALGVTRMARRNALVRRLASVETLGCTTVICTDKTGTLTRDEMTVRRLWTASGTFALSGSGYAPNGQLSRLGLPARLNEHPGLRALLEAGALCNGAHLSESDGLWQAVGDPTEAALLTAAAKAGLDLEALEEEHPAAGEVPFDAERRRMSVLRAAGGGLRLHVKGAPEVVLALCTSVRRDGRDQPLSAADAADIEGAQRAMATQALRVLAMASRELPAGAAPGPELECGLTFLGLAGMMDTPRPEARDAVARCRRAGVRVVMVTGDHRETAAAVAREVGLLQPGSEVLTGADLERMTPAVFDRAAASAAVFARVSAEQKLHLVQSLARQGQVVAVTGDGVNDAPALRAAAIGVAMGRNGSDVARQASDLVLLDDDFATIVSAIEEGRGIYDNILRFVYFLLACNLGELGLIFLAMLIGLKDAGGALLVPLSAVQLLWLNLVTDGLPALALGLDPAAPAAMARPPRHPSRALLNARSGTRIALGGAIVASASLAACIWALPLGAEAARSVTLTAMVAIQLAWLYNTRRAYGLAPLSNPWLVAAAATSAGLQLALLYVPALRAAFSTVPLGPPGWLIVAAATGAAWGAGLLLDHLLPHDGKA